MKTTTWLIAILAPVLAFAQEPTPSPTPSEAHLFAQRLTNATTLAQVADLETEFASKLDQWSRPERDGLLRGLIAAYSRVFPGGKWQFNVIPKYVSWGGTWEATGDLPATYYVNILGPVVFRKMYDDTSAVTTVQQLDSLAEQYFSTNAYPEFIAAQNKDSRSYNAGAVLQELAGLAAALGHPQAVNWALQNYRNTSLRAGSRTNIDLAVQVVAQALKAKDLNIARANAWIESQNTGQPGVVFTEDELALPTALAPVADKPWLATGTQAQLDAAKRLYVSSKSSAGIDAAIIDIANVLKAKDLNLARANAWIEAQKTGQAFDLKLE